jgi:hypothetical protein
LLGQERLYLVPLQVQQAVKADVEVGQAELKQVAQQLPRLAEAIHAPSRTVSGYLLTDELRPAEYIQWRSSRSSPRQPRV